MGFTKENSLCYLGLGYLYTNLDPWWPMAPDSYGARSHAGSA